MTSLYETARPTCWDDLVGQDAARAILDRLRQRGGLDGRAYWLVGPSGVGKTSMARLIAAECGEAWASDEIDAADLDIDTCRRWEREAQGRPIGGGGWTKIVNEAGSLRGPILKRLLTLLESPAVQSNMTVIFTTTPTGQARLFDGDCEMPAFRSRVTLLELCDNDVWAVAGRVQTVARAEGLDGQPLQEYYRLAVECDGNMRAMFQRVEAGEMLS